MVNGQFTEWIEILAGVLNLGPLLIYIDDIISDIECDMFICGWHITLRINYKSSNFSYRDLSRLQ